MCFIFVTNAFFYFQIIPAHLEQAHLTIRLSRQTVHFAKQFNQEANAKEKLEQDNRHLEEALTQFESVK